MKEAPLVGIWLDKEDTLHLAHRGEGDEIAQLSTAALSVMAWAPSGESPIDGAECEGLAGSGRLNSLVRFPNVASARAALKERGRDWVWVRPLEHQFLIQKQERLFASMRFAEVRRCQLDIETASADPTQFPDPHKAEDRILAIGLQLSHEDAPRILRLSERTNAGEKALLEALNSALAATDPDVIEGHNIYNFDLRYLRERCRRLKVPCAWGRGGAKAVFRQSRVRIAERWMDFLRCDLPGRTVFDTYLALQLFDVTTRDLPNYKLKTAARYFGITEDADERTYIPGDRIQYVFDDDPERFDAYLIDDLREARGLANRLLPTYIAQAQNFPMLLQEICLRGTGAKVDLVLMERYYAARHALPDPSVVEGFAGAFSKSYGSGVFHNVLHFDVASLYPSLLLQIARNPSNDELGALIPLLKELRTYRLDYKKRAREASDPEERAEFDARQASFKILINSFYGYLGFAGARFADSALAAEVTQRGRDLLQGLIAWFEERGLRVLEADTDGLYVEGGASFETRLRRCWPQHRRPCPKGLNSSSMGALPPCSAIKPRTMRCSIRAPSRCVVPPCARVGRSPFSKKRPTTSSRFSSESRQRHPTASSSAWKSRSATDPCRSNASPKVSSSA
jgi:DNA polymerase I